MRTLTNNELHRLRHIVAEQANDAQLAASGQYLSLSRLDAQDVADALEELVALRASEEDAAREDMARKGIITARLDTADEEVDAIGEALDNLSGALTRLREAVEG